MPRPAKWNSPTASVRLPDHLIPRLVEIAKNLDQSPPQIGTGEEFKGYCCFVQNSALPKLVTIQDSSDGFQERRYLMQVDDPLSFEEWREVSALAEQVEQKYLAGMSSGDRLYLLSRMIQEVFPEVDLQGQRIQGGEVNADG